MMMGILGGHILARDLGEQDDGELEKLVGICG